MSKQVFVKRGGRAARLFFLNDALDLEFLGMQAPPSRQSTRKLLYDLLSYKPFSLKSALLALTASLAGAFPLFGIYI